MRAFSKTDKGKRREMNQDYVYTSEGRIGNLPNLCILADGMGGHNAGDYASRYTVETIVDSIEKDEQKEPVSIIEQAIQRANQAILEKAKTDIDLDGMGTTVVVATIVDNEMYVANVGDSRLYVIGEEIHQITKDHSFVQEMVRRGELNAKDARVHPDRNIITRAIGGAKPLEVDFFEVELKEKERVLMCSDGLTDMIEDEDILKILKEQKSTADGIECLVETANENGGNDNITVVVIEPFSDEVKTC
ncbi:Stp1/IreP family PP2C-type Ser/Thr phosphatase [Roseburia sp. MSJ-14]|uniref:Stp1/IreP family PP2C-type Ser/Thr phosphatase n=1 Tax=Roseburia sp. MSJ-14 TaxID=2841514 RepID=UPI001C128DA0|nr:Stp1/IreP family PP2C-type Ser/Thr phosphatase [Roseburia sp. MSJ-14]MBU5473918.1 Stp1/IreP family PP2C-type Ser/Thr phosphatase [Roseburia sp. MSJ-14]